MLMLYGCTHGWPYTSWVTGQFAYSLVIFGHFAYWSFCLRVISPTTWTVRLQIAYFAYKTIRIKSDV